MTWSTNIDVDITYGELDDLAEPATVRRVQSLANELNARETYRHSQRRVPVDTRALKESGRVYRDGPVVWVLEYVGGAGGREYASHVEFGTRKMPAQPFIRPSIEKTDTTKNGYQALKEVTGAS